MAGRLQRVYAHIWGSRCSPWARRHTRQTTAGRWRRRGWWWGSLGRRQRRTRPSTWTAESPRWRRPWTDSSQRTPSSRHRPVPTPLTTPYHITTSSASSIYKFHWWWRQWPGNYLAPDRGMNTPKVFRTPQGWLTPHVPNPEKYPASGG